MEPGGAPYAIESDGVAVWLRLTPKGGRDALEGVETLSDGRRVVKARVRAAPEDGRANEALIALIAKTLATPKSAVTIASGATARVKKIRIAGADAASVAQRLATHLENTDG